MSVASATSKIAYAGNNSTVTAYTIPFYFQDNAHIVCVVTDSDGVETTLALTTDYTLTGADNPGGGTLTTVAAWDNTHTVTIFREVPATQLTTYSPNDSFPASSHEKALDKLTYLVQQNARKIAQCLQVTEASDSPTPAASVPLSVAGLDGSGQLVFRTVDEMVSFLSLSGAVSSFPGATWANNTERAAKVPDYLGQLGYQRDTQAIWYSTGTSAGNWGLVPAGVNWVGMSNLQDLAVSTAKIQNRAVTAAKQDTGVIIQNATATYSTYATVAAQIPLDDTIPQSTEGTQILSLSFTPNVSGSSVRLRLSGYAHTAETSAQIVYALFNGAANAIAAGVSHIGATTVATYTNGAYCFLEVVLTGVSGAQTYTARIGQGNAAMSVYVNGNTSNRLLGGVMAWRLTAEEIRV